MTLSMSISLRQTFECRGCLQNIDSTRAWPLHTRPRDVVTGEVSAVSAIALGCCPMCWMPVDERDIIAVAQRVGKIWFDREKRRQRRARKRDAARGTP